MVQPYGHVGTERLNLRARPNNRLLGVVLERSRGVVYDVLGVNGRRASALLSEDRVLWSSQVAQRQPDLVILGFGGNETLDEHLSPKHFASQLTRTLEMVRGAAPEASCMVLAPVAMCERPRLGPMVEVQRTAAQAHGCAFWDTTRVSGGLNSLCEWQGRGLVSSDGLHLTPEGYGVVGDSMAAAVLSVLDPKPTGGFDSP